MNYKKKIETELVQIGLTTGDAVVVHSSLSSLGNFSNKAQFVIEALLEVLGKEGTLLIPALSYENVTKGNAKFSVNNTPSCVGGLSEYFRNLTDSYGKILYAEAYLLKTKPVWKKVHEMLRKDPLYFVDKKISAHQNRKL